MLTGRQKRLILALVSEPTIRRACAKAGIGERTFRRWRRRSPEFVAALDEVRRQAFAEAVGNLKAALPRAQRALVRCLKANRPADVIRAARACFDIVRSESVIDLEVRIAKLEANQKDKR